MKTMKILTVFLALLIFHPSNLLSQHKIGRCYTAINSVGIMYLKQDNINCNFLVKYSDFNGYPDHSGHHFLHFSLECGIGDYSIDYVGLSPFIVLDTYSYHIYLSDRFTMAGFIRPIYLTAYRNSNDEWKKFQPLGTISFSVEYMWKTKKVDCFKMHDARGITLFIDYRVLYSHWNDGFAFGTSFNF